MFLYLLGALLGAAAIHIALLEPRTTERAGTVALLYLLVGYCGVPMLGVSVATLASPDPTTSGSPRAIRSRRSSGGRTWGCR